MRYVILLALLVTAAAGCAKNRESEESGARIHDTTLTSKDSMKPTDTMPHIRDSMPDSTRK